MNTMFINSSILITGGTGSWGQELTRQLLLHSPREVRIYSRGEHRQVEMKRHLKDNRVTYIIGDVRERERLLLASREVDYIFHLAALKHVPVCEENPWQAVHTNIIGTQNVIDCATANDVKRVIYVSTDKAVDPANLYGVTKACGEKLIIAANLISKHTRFVCIRGGNVIGTTGSVIPLFREQLQKLNEVTLTDEQMTRFFMRLTDAVRLLLKAATDAYGGEIIVMKMPACSIRDLASVMVRKLGNNQSRISVIGARPGEKLHEILVSRYETARTRDVGDYFVIFPSILIPDTSSQTGGDPVDFIEFNSMNTEHLTEEAIERLIEADGWFDESYKEALQPLQSLDPSTLKDFFTAEGWVNHPKI